jgi:hypothetical protein
MTTTLTAPVFAAGDKVTYMGYPATVTTSNAPMPGWDDEPGTHAGIRFDRAVRGMSRQMEVPASALLPAAVADFTEGWGYAQERADYDG